VVVDSGGIGRALPGVADAFTDLCWDPVATAKNASNVLSSARLEALWRMSVRYTRLWEQCQHRLSSEHTSLPSLLVNRCVHSGEREGGRLTPILSVQILIDPLPQHWNRCCFVGRRAELSFIVPADAGLIVD